MKVQVAPTQGPGSKGLEDLTLRLGGITLPRDGDDLVVHPVNSHSRLRPEESTSYVATLSGPRGDFLRAAFFEHAREQPLQAGMRGSLQSQFSLPAVECEYLVDGKPVRVSGYLEPAGGNAGVVISNPSGAPFSRDAKPATTADLLQLARRPDRLVQAAALLKLENRGPSGGTVDLTVTIIDRSSTPSTSDGWEALADLSGHRVRVVETSKENLQEWRANGSRPGRLNTGSVSGIVKQIERDSSGEIVSATLITSSGQESVLKAAHHVIAQVDHIRLPARYEYALHGEYPEMFDAFSYIQNRFERGAAIDVTFRGREVDPANPGRPVEKAQKVEGHFWQVCKDKDEDTVVVLCDKNGSFFALREADIRSLVTTQVGRSDRWEDRFETYTEPKGRGDRSAGVSFSPGGLRSAREIPTETIWSHTFHGDRWILDSI